MSASLFNDLNVQSMNIIDHVTRYVTDSDISHIRHNYVGGKIMWLWNIIKTNYGSRLINLI